MIRCTARQALPGMDPLSPHRARSLVICDTVTLRLFSYSAALLVKHIKKPKSFGLSVAKGERPPGAGWLRSTVALRSLVTLCKALFLFVRFLLATTSATTLERRAFKNRFSFKINTKESEQECGDFYSVSNSSDTAWMFHLLLTDLITSQLYSFIFCNYNIIIVFYTYISLV